MVDEFKSIRENLFKALSGKRGDDGDDDGESSGSSLGIDAGAAKALVGALFARAGKGKDEVVQTMAREIGLAVAAMLKEPLAQLAKNQKLQISFEFVPKDAADAAKTEPPAPAKAEPKASLVRGAQATAGRKKKGARAVND